MATSVQQPQVRDLSAASELSDQDWLKSLNFRNGADTQLRTASADGDIATFCSLLSSESPHQPIPGGSVRKLLLQQLKSLREQAGNKSELEKVLFDSGLKKAERSVAIEAFIAEESSDPPQAGTLCDALWVLHAFRGKLEQNSYFALWRWALQQGQCWLEERPVCDPEQGLSQLRFLEVCYLIAITFPELQGSRKLLKETTGLIRSCLEESIDNDGTPQPLWLPGIADSLSLLGRLTLIAMHTEHKLWNSSSQRMLDNLISRVISFGSPQHIAFSQADQAVPYSRLAIATSILSSEPNAAASRLLELWSQGKTVTNKKLSDWSLPEASHQSDWSQCAVLRSGWQSPADLCVVAHDGTMPLLDVVIADTPLFQGVWKHELILDGQRIECDADWTCSCWYCDEEVCFIELIQDVDATTRIVRQIILNRDQQQLLLNHAVHSPNTSEIRYRCTLPLSRQWNVESDTTTREAAIVGDKKRVRVIPLSLPQPRVTGCQGEIEISEKTFAVAQNLEGDRLFLSTLLDWSNRRKSKPADWSRIAVAQDGKLEPIDHVAAYRCRIGRDQWILYHSLVQPEIPRTVMGLHTPHETVFSKFSLKAGFEPIVEVEM